MSYLEAFLAEHARLENTPKRPGPQAAKAAKAPSAAFAGTTPPRSVEPGAQLSTALSVREVLGFPAGLLCELPIPTTLVLDLPSAKTPLLVGTHSACPKRALNAEDWITLATLAAAGNIDPRSFTRWATERRQVQPPDTSSPVLPRRTITVGQVLQQLGVSLRAVVLESRD